MKLACVAPALLLSGCLGSLVSHVVDTERQPTLTFTNRLGVPVCAINLWRPSQPAEEAAADWMELTDVVELEPGASLTVGFVPHDGRYFVRALGCRFQDEVLFSRELAQVVPGTTLSFEPESRATPPPTAPLPSSVGL
jgi:hypothetical protein